MRVDKKICSIQYDVKLTFTNEEKETLRNALSILKVLNTTLEEGHNDHSMSSLSVEKDVNDIVLEIDKYTDYICKQDNPTESWAFLFQAVSAGSYYYRLFRRVPFTTSSLFSLFSQILFYVFIIFTNFIRISFTFVAFYTINALKNLSAGCERGGYPSGTHINFFNFFHHFH